DFNSPLTLSAPSVPLAPGCANAMAALELPPARPSSVAAQPQPRPEAWFSTSVPKRLLLVALPSKLPTTAPFALATAVEAARAGGVAAAAWFVINRPTPHAASSVNPPIL